MRGNEVGLDVRADHPSRDEITKRMRSFRTKVYRRELKRMLKAQSGESSSLKRSLVNFLKDLNHYIDFLVARHIVWRETRSRTKPGIPDGEGEK